MRADLRRLHGGHLIRLGQLLGRGGEGHVFAIDECADEVAKVYVAHPDLRKSAKLKAMVAAGSQSLLRVAAWPKDLLVDGKNRVCGFLMPRLTARRDVHELYSPKSRADSFPEVDFRFLCHVGTNIARAFALVHEHGHVIGDVNHGNLLVGTDGTVVLIDCDSFQIRSGPELFTCDVGTPLFTGPELQNKPLRNLPRTSDHDGFGLAVLLFHLLYMGRHPFAGRYAGPGEMPIERAIAERRFAYGPGRASYGMERPPGTLSLEAMGSEISTLFVQAFGSHGTAHCRPDAKAWLRCLEDLKAGLRTCSTAEWHRYPGHLSRCIWCEIELATSSRLFGQRIPVKLGTGLVDVATIWQQIVRVEDPGPDPALPNQRPWVPPAGYEPPQRLLRRVRKAVSVLTVCCGFIACEAAKGLQGWISWLAFMLIARTVWPTVEEEDRRRAETAFAEACNAWERSLLRWRREASRSSFSDKLRELTTIKEELADLGGERLRRVAALEANKESSQLHRYLDRFRIDRAKIKGIGPGRTAMLESYGIETAADIRAEAIFGIQGFGESLTRELIKWRSQHEVNFRFNPNEPLDPRDLRAMDVELETRRQELFEKLREGPGGLMRLRAEITAARARLMPALEREWDQHEIARLRREAL